MRWLLLALCACNRILGLGDVGVRDAPIFDAPVDAQPYCPTAGVVPQFAVALHQVVDQNCSAYTGAASGIAVAMCTSAETGLPAPSQGPIDMPLVPIEGLPTLDTSTHAWVDIRISPEGDVLYIDDFDFSSIAIVYRTFTRVDGVTWRAGPNLPMTTYGFATTPSRSPHRHLLFFDYTTQMQMQEWVEDDAGTWHSIRTTMLGPSSPQLAWLAADGLRATFITGTSPPQLMYMDRTSIDDAFNAAVMIPSLPPVHDLFITSDCTRAYFSAVQSIFYATQI